VGALAPQHVIAALQHEPLVVEALKLSSKLRSACDSPRELWALGVVATRRCTVLCNEQPPGRTAAADVVVPLFDLANHSAQPELEFTWVRGALELVCTADVAAGSQLRIRYGAGVEAHHSDALFLTYGMHDGASPDSVMLWRSQWHLAGWLLALGGPGNQAALAGDARFSNGGAGWDGPNSWQVAPFSRAEWLCLTRTSDGELEVDESYHAVLSSPQFDCAARAEALLRLRAAQLLAALPTSVDADGKELQCCGGDALLAAAICCRMAKKRLLALCL
jgi:hypothetical protein